MLCPNRHLVVAILLLAGAGCLQPDDATLDGASGKGDVYGDDDRLDWHRAPAQWQAIAKQSVVSFTTPDALRRWRSSREYDTLIDRGYCADEKFVHQPVIAYASGYLVDRDLVASAGHVWSSTTCTEDCDAAPKEERASCMAQRSRIVFGLRYNSYTSLDPVSDDDVYYCDSLVAGTHRGYDDWAIMRLDRPVGADKVPVEVRDLDAEPVSLGDEAVTLISHLAGLPVKISPDGIIRGQRDYEDGTFGYWASVDASAGASGAPLFDGDGRLVAHLTNGPRGSGKGTYYDEDAGCVRQVRRADSVDEAFVTFRPATFFE